MQDALELRTYLHDRLLMAYADTLEASGKNLSELLATSPTELTTEYKMRRGHVARFLDRGSACGVQMPDNLVLPARKVTAAHRKKTDTVPFGIPGTPNHHSKRAPVSESGTPATTPKPRFDQINNVGDNEMSPHNLSMSFTARMSTDGTGRPSSFTAPGRPSSFIGDSGNARIP